MISTKTLITDVHSIPSTWVFDYYLDLPEKLAGQDVKITSKEVGSDLIEEWDLDKHQKVLDYVVPAYVEAIKPL